MQSLGESFNFVKHFQSLSFFVGIAVKRYHGSQIQKKKKKNPHDVASFVVGHLISVPGLISTPNSSSRLPGTES